MRRPPIRPSRVEPTSPDAPAGSPERPDERFPPRLRLRSSPEFARVYDAKCRAGDGVLLIFGAPRPEDDPDLTFRGRPSSRVGLSVSKKNGNAVARHRIKRLLREAFRTSKAEVPAGWDFVLIPRPHSGADLRRYRNSLVKLSRRLPGQWAKKRPPANGPDR